MNTPLSGGTLTTATPGAKRARVFSLIKMGAMIGQALPHMHASESWQAGDGADLSDAGAKADMEVDAQVKAMNLFIDELQNEGLLIAVDSVHAGNGVTLVVVCGITPQPSHSLGADPHTI